MCLAFSVFRYSDKASSRIVFKEDYRCQPLGAEHRDQRRPTDRKEAAGSGWGEDSACHPLPAREKATKALTLTWTVRIIVTTNVYELSLWVKESDR